MTDATLPAGFQKLRELYPWPSEPRYPDVEPVGRQINGYDLVEETARGLGKDQLVIMEVGAEFGASTRRSLGLPGSYVVSVDPWPDEYAYNSFAALQKFKGTEHAMLDLFQTFNFEYRDRLVAVREYSPSGPRVVYDAGIKPDLVYLDGDHAYDAVVRDLTVVTTLFPDAIVAGDDWNYDLKNRRFEGISYPVRTAVKRWAGFWDVAVETRGNTWMIDTSKPYNLDRVRPVFGNQGTAQRLAALEKSQAAVEKSQRDVLKLEKEIAGSLRNLPSRRVLRKIRSTVKGKR